MESKKKYKKFTDYYADPVFKEKFLSKQKEKIVCELCGRETSRINMPRHKKTKLCQKRQAEQKGNPYLQLKNEIEELKDVIKILKQDV